MDHMIKLFSCCHKGIYIFHQAQCGIKLHSVLNSYNRNSTPAALSLCGQKMDIHNKANLLHQEKKVATNH